MFNCFFFYSSSIKYLQVPSFSDKFEFWVKSKMAAILVTILDDVTTLSSTKTPNIYLIL